VIEEIGGERGGDSSGECEGELGSGKTGSVKMGAPEGGEGGHRGK